MRVAIFSDFFYPELSGVADTIVVTGTELARRGHQIEYFVPAYSEKDYQIGGVSRKELELGANIKVHRMLSVHIPAPTRQGRGIVPNPLRGFFTRGKFDLVHTHGYFNSGFEAFFFSKIKRVPLIGTNHTFTEAFSPVDNKFVKSALGKYAAWYYNRCDFVVTPSRFLLKDMQTKGFRAPAAVISNPIAEPFFHPRAPQAVLKKELNLPEFTVLYAGRLSPEKNPEVLMKGFISFAQKVPHSCLVIIGQGVLRSALENMARESGLSPKQIKFAGPFLGDNKKTFYDFFHAADVFVMPSTSESQSMSSLQAMANGVPVLVADSGPLPELVASGGGLIFGPDNPDELSQELAELYQKPDLRKKLGENARLYAQKLTVSAVADKWEKTYNEVIKSYYAKRGRT